MQTQLTTATMPHIPTPTPQGDGDPGSPSRVISTTERDLRLSLIVEQILPLLWEAVQAHALGVVDDRPIASAPKPLREHLRRLATAVVHAPSRLHREEALQAARSQAARFLRAEALYVVAEDDDRPYQQLVVRTAIEALIRRVVSSASEHTVLTEILDAYQHQLTQPLAMSRASQEALTMLRLEEIVGGGCRRCGDPLETTTELTSGLCDACWTRRTAPSSGGVL